MKFLRSAWLLLAAPVLTQAPAPTSDEFVRLQPALRQAVLAAAPFVVTVETFGGTRTVSGTDGPMDGEAPPAPRPQPTQPPESEPPEREPPQDPARPAPKDDKPKDDKPKLPLVAKGFQQAQGRSTGVIVGADGWIVTSRFALALEPTTVLVTVPGRGTFHAVRAGEDTSRGIALLRIDAADLPVPEHVPPAEVEVGQWALALGRTFAAEQPTLHLGIVSARERLFGRALQIDAYTSPANYGGAVVDVRGRLLGIAVPLSPSGRNAGVEWYDSGIGFAVTLGNVPELVARMQRGDVLQRAWLGVQLASDHLGPGARLAGVPPGGPAAAAGLGEGDVVLAVDGVAVRNGPHLQMLVNSRLGGDRVTLQVAGAEGGREIGPIVLRDAPWSEQKRASDELPASFPLPAGDDKR